MDIVSFRPQNKDERRKRKKELRKFNLEKAKLVRDLKDRPCKDCGQLFEPEAMDFDHVPGRGPKVHNVSAGGSLQAVIMESYKCDVVCANCHRIRTRNRRNAKRQQKESRRKAIDGLAALIQREREAMRGIPNEAADVLIHEQYES